MSCAAALAQDASTIEAGRRLYMTGLRADGTALTATVSGDVPVAAPACVNCHKRSGLGASEGGNRALPIHAPALFQAPVRGLSAIEAGAVVPPANRRPYDDETLRRAIGTGVAVDGRPLSPLMPRYALREEDAQALSAYLHTLGAAAAPGVTGTSLELATLVVPDAPPSARDAVRRVLEKFTAIKNGGTRKETERAAQSRRALYGERHARAYRRWNLSVWTLSGPPAEWEAQLETYYSAKPPFAIISGALGSADSLVHDFCERHAVPCVLPISTLPPERSEDFYSVYFSPGARLDARVTARDAATVADPQARVLLLHTDARDSLAARDAFRQAWRSAGRGPVIEESTPADTVPSYAQWKELVNRHRPDVIVAWISDAQLQALSAIAVSTKLLPQLLYTAQSFTDWSKVQVPATLANRVRHVFPYQVNAQGRAYFPRETVWLNSFGLADVDPVAGAQALFACHATGEALAGMTGNFSREYLIETLEHMLDGTNMVSLFPATTLGTGQRFLAKGAYVVRLGRFAAGTAPVFSEPRWIQP